MIRPSARPRAGSPPRPGAAQLQVPALASAPRPRPAPGLGAGCARPIPSYRFQVSRETSVGFTYLFLLTSGWPLDAISSSRATWHRDVLGASGCQLCGDTAPQKPPGSGGCSPAPPQLQRRQDAGSLHVPRVRVHPHGGFLESCTWARPAKLRAAARTPAAPPAQLSHLFQVTDG